MSAPSAAVSTPPQTVASPTSNPAPTSGTTAATAPSGGNLPTGPINLFTAAAAAASQGNNNNNNGGGGEGNAASGGANALSFLRTNPQFQQLRQLVQTQPHLLQPLLQQLGQSNPQLLQVSVFLLISYIFHIDFFCVSFFDFKIFC